MSSTSTIRKAWLQSCIGAAGLAAASVCGAGTAGAATFVDPPVFTSQNGVLDIMMVAIPQPIPTISFTPPSSHSVIHPTGWVYQICPRPASGLSAPATAARTLDLPAPEGP